MKFSYLLCPLLLSVCLFVFVCVCIYKNYDMNPQFLQKSPALFLCALFFSAMLWHLGEHSRVVCLVYHYLLYFYVFLYTYL
jgi:hypothetical protein